MNAIRRRLRDQGTAAVEFAIVAPLLLMLVFGMIDFGRMANARITLNAAARAAARAEAQGLDPGTAAHQVSADVTVSGLTACPIPATAANTASATVRYQFDFITPVGFLIGKAASQVQTRTATGVVPCPD